MIHRMLPVGNGGTLQDIDLIMIEPNFVGACFSRYGKKPTPTDYGASYQEGGTTEFPIVAWGFDLTNVDEVTIDVETQATQTHTRGHMLAIQDAYTNETHIKYIPFDRNGSTLIAQRKTYTLDVKDISGLKYVCIINGYYQTLKIYSLKAIMRNSDSLRL